MKHQLSVLTALWQMILSGTQSDVICTSERNVLRYVQNDARKSFASGISKGRFQIVYEWINIKKRTRSTFFKK